MSMAKRSAAVFAATVLAMIGIGAVPASAGIPANRSSAVAATPIQEMGRALASQPGTGDIFCFLDNTFRSHANGLLVSMRVEESGRLSAVAGAEGPWERFLVCRGIANGATYIYSYVARRYVSVRIDEGGVVRATGVAPGPWELFYTSGNPGPDNRPNTTVLHANANGTYVSVRIEDGGRMRTGFREIGPWEVFSW